MYGDTQYIHSIHQMFESINLLQLDRAVANDNQQVGELQMEG